MRAVTLHAGLLAVIVFGVSQQAYSQLVDFLTSPGYSQLIHNTLTNSVVNNASGRGNRRSSSTSRTSSSATSASQSSTDIIPAYRTYPAVRFKPTGTRLTLQEYLGSVNLPSQEKVELKELILAMWDVYEQEATSKGYPNDLALALVSSLELNSHVYQGKTGKLSQPFGQNIGIRDVIAEYATDNGTFNSLSDRQKQELYELFIMLGTLTYHYYEKARKENNAEEIKNTRSMAEHNLKLLGAKP